uniref:Tail sheath protein subtilisin-like domain-containing protein n=1 Tax=Candidatus Kentrum sp. TC TaxID=2126339 RepID=A0A450YW39_9GAMM|nr:MAG: hypothetical protein BECKTC1821E_GA0114239_105417 [Candidatus Kentron sp. TC]
MPANYLHGVESFVVDKGPRPVRLVKAATSACVGTAIGGPVNEPILILSEEDAARFGPYSDGFTIASALDANFDQARPNAGVCVCVNVLDPAAHKSAATEESITLDPVTDRAALAHPGVMSLVLKSQDGAATYAENADYLIDAMTGELTRVESGGIAAGATVKASYEYPDPAKVTTGDIIGGVNGDGHRVGLAALKDCYNLFGFHPKRIICPGYSQLPSVSTEMISIADALRARAYIDAPPGLSPSEALAGRGPSGTFGFNTASHRAILCYPHVEVGDGEGGVRLEPLSQRLAGLGNAVDLERGYWWSSSNQEIRGVIGLERKISCAVNDPTTEANLLNEAGIVTVFSGRASGLRRWGNRSAAWPANSDPLTFESFQAVMDIFRESMEYHSMQHLDAPVTKAWLDARVEEGNAFIRRLIGDGALVGGKCWFDPERNPPDKMALGQYVFSSDMMGALPAERITFETSVNTAYLATLANGE